MPTSDAESEVPSSQSEADSSRQSNVDPTPQIDAGHITISSDESQILQNRPIRVPSSPYRMPGAISTSELTTMFSSTSISDDDPE